MRRAMEAMTWPSTHVIKVPDVGEGVAEVELVAWHVQVGDRVAEDQALADVMTDKASVEIPSPVAGRVLALGGAVGQTMAVGAELIRIEVEDATGAAESPQAAAAAAAAAAPAPQAPPPRRPARPHPHGPDLHPRHGHTRSPSWPNVRSHRPPCAGAPGSRAST